jgi:hypothetical protein
MLNLPRLAGNTRTGKKCPKSQMFAIFLFLNRFFVHKEWLDCLIRLLVKLFFFASYRANSQMQPRAKAPYQQHRKIPANMDFSAMLATRLVEISHFCSKRFSSSSLRHSRR